MKRRILSIVMVSLLLMAFAPLAAQADGGEYTAWFGAQMDPVDGWNLGDIGMTTFDIGEPATISIDFGETVSFGEGNYMAIETDLPNPFDGVSIFVNPSVAEVLSFKLDGNEVEMGGVLVNAEGKDAKDGSGPGLRLTFTNKWNGDIIEQPVDPVELGEFTTLEIEFIVHSVSPEYTAKFGAQMDPVDGWDLGDVAVTTFRLGAPAVISINFGETVSFGDGNFIAIETNLPNPYDGVDIFADSDIAEILSFTLDGHEIGMGDVLINAEGMEAIDGSGPGLRLTLTNKWNGSIEEQPVDPLELGEFTTLEIEFVIYGVGEAQEQDEGEFPAELYGMEFNAWIGGTFLDAETEDETGFDWVQYQDQATTFKINETFTVAVDFGGDTQTHGEASWGYITVVQTDIMERVDSMMNAYIESITVDGNNVRFNADMIEVGFDNGIRIALTSKWADDSGSAVIAGTQAIGTFSKMEITMAFCDLEFRPDYAGEAADDDGASAPIEPPPPVIIDSGSGSDSETEPESGGLPGWAIPAIIGGALAIIAVVLIVVVKKK